MTKLDAKALTHALILDSLNADVVEIDCANNGGVGDETLRAIAATCGAALQVLDLTRSPFITDAGVAALAACTSLTTLLLASTAVSDAGLVPVVTAAARLEVLDVDGCEGPAAVERQFGLHTASSESAPGVTDLTLLALGASSRATLRELRCSGCPDITEAGVAALVGCTTLTVLCIDAETATDATIASLVGASASGLRELCVSSTGAGDATLRAVGVGPSARTLRKLNIGGCAAVTNDGVAALATCSGLVKLEVYQTSIGDEGLARVSAAATGLEELVAWNCPNVGDQTLLALGSSPCASTLRLVALSFGAATDVGAAALANCVGLVTLHLTDMPGITDASLTRVVAAVVANLQHLDVSRTGMGDATLDAIVMRPVPGPLWYLRCAGTNATAKAIEKAAARLPVNVRGGGQEKEKPRGFCC